MLSTRRNSLMNHPGGEKLFGAGEPDIRMGA